MKVFVPKYVGEQVHHLKLHYPIITCSDKHTCLMNGLVNVYSTIRITGICRR